MFLRTLKSLCALAFDPLSSVQGHRLPVTSALYKIWTGVQWGVTVVNVSSKEANICGQSVNYDRDSRFNLKRHALGIDPKFSSGVKTKATNWHRPYWFALLLHGIVWTEGRAEEQSSVTPAQTVKPSAVSAAQPAASSPRKIALAGQLADKRGYSLLAEFTSDAKEGARLSKLTLEISGKPVVLPVEGWNDLLVLPAQSSFSISEFAGDVSLWIACQVQDRKGAARLRLRDGQLVERELAAEGVESTTVHYQPRVELTTGVIPPEELAKLRTIDAQAVQTPANNQPTANHP
jgi:hypothetical protein